MHEGGMFGVISQVYVLNKMCQHCIIVCLFVCLFVVTRPPGEPQVGECNDHSAPVLGLHP